MVGASLEARYRSAWHQKQRMRGEEFIHCAEGGVALAQRDDFAWREACSPLQAIAYCRFEEIEVACMKLGSLRRLNRREDFYCLGPPAGIDRMRFQAKTFEVADHGAKTFHDLWLAIVEETVGATVGKAGEGRSAGDFVRCEGRRRAGGASRRSRKSQPMRCRRTRPDHVRPQSPRAERGLSRRGQSAAGTRTEPPVSVPMAATADPSCTLAAEPLEEPPVSD